MTRRLVAALACRAGGLRLYGKPLQNLEPGFTILDCILNGFDATPEINEVVLGISEGDENLKFAAVARSRGIGHILGDEKDVLWRLILCGRAGNATDVFRITSECPFPAWEFVSGAWQRHLDEENDITVTDFLPEGCNFEIYRLSALERSHREGEDGERSEICSGFARRRHDLFQIGVVEPPEKLRRLDLRLTVDYPEDLVVCREVYLALKQHAPRIPIEKAIEFLDGRSELTGLVAPYVVPEPLWAHTISTLPATPPASV